MPDKTDEFVEKIRELADQLMAASELGFSGFDDDRCLLLSGIARDCAYRLRESVDGGGNPA